MKFIAILLIFTSLNSFANQESYRKFCSKNNKSSVDFLDLQSDGRLTYGHNNGSAIYVKTGLWNFDNNVLTVSLCNIFSNPISCNSSIIKLSASNDLKTIDGFFDCK